MCSEHQARGLISEVPLFLAYQSPISPPPPPPPPPTPPPLSPPFPPPLPDTFSEYVLPYDAIRTAKDPERMLMNFLMSTYEAAAINGNWDRKALETTFGVPGKPRAV